MTSDVSEAFVWIWLPGDEFPTVAGRVEAEGRVVRFNYGRSYLDNDRAIALYEPELPLRAGVIAPGPDHDAAGCLLDAGPDSWGQRIILDRLLGLRGPQADTISLSPLTYLVHAGSDRIGALDFQSSATEYVDRSGETTTTLDELLRVADLIDQREPLSDVLDAVLLHGSSIGGARPKALLDADGRKLIAKFSSSTDSYPVVESEFVAMELARRCGLDVAPVELVPALDRRALVVERFDRVRTPDGWHRRAFVSALTILGLGEMFARYATYHELARVIEERFIEPTRTLRELFGRIVFNILCSNGDDHARNHGAFWNGRELELTPAYDVCPGQRSGRTYSQVMEIGAGDKASQLLVCLKHAGVYRLSQEEARSIIDAQVDAIREHWIEVCERAGLTAGRRDAMWGRQFLNPFAFEGYGPEPVSTW